MQQRTPDGYSEMPPPRDFASMVECLWFSRSGQIRNVPVHPDGCVDVILRAPRRVAGSRGRFAADVVGIMTSTRTVSVASDDVYAGIRFRPGHAFSAISPTVATLSDRTVSLSALRPGLFERVIARAADAPPGDLLALVLSALMTDAAEVAGDLQGAIDALSTSDGRLPLSDCLAIAHLSERHFRRQCVERVGLPPKSLARLLRFRRAVAGLRAQSPLPMSALALECGYSDQAHMIREVRSISGVTPAKLQSP